MRSDAEKLRERLHRIDSRGYKAYRDIQGRWELYDFTLYVNHIQGDPFASPSRIRVVVPAACAGFEPSTYSNPSRSIGLTALLARRFGQEARRQSQKRGSGKSGEIRIESPGQEVLAQTAVLIDDNGNVEARFTVGLPARGRRVLGIQAAQLLLEDIPAIVDSSLRADAYDSAQIWQHVATNEDADTLRTALDTWGLVAFVADGAILPRRSGVDDRPLQEGRVVPLQSPDTLRVRIQLPHAGEVTGMGIPAGVTLIVGGGYHGKSTLLRAIERGIYNHRPGDGRQQVVSHPGLVKIRAEDGRAVTGVDISPFIDNLPLAQSTRSFHTANASGSTSQAAAIMEALEVGASGLLIDEDTAATNFMIRDSRMQALVPKESEPITPFIDRVRQLYDEHGVSSILVIGGSGDYLDVADTVIAMRSFRPANVTPKAQQIAREQPTGRISEALHPFHLASNRSPRPQSLDPSRGRRRVSIRPRDAHTIQFGTETIDLAAVEQIVSWAQTRAIGEAIWHARQRHMDGNRSLADVLDATMDDIRRQGLDVLDKRQVGDLAAFRRYELAAALNRLRPLAVN